MMNSTQFKRGHKFSEETKKKISETLKKRGIKPKERFHATMENHPSWKGGITLHSNGYVLVKKPTHSRANAQGYVPQHVLIAEKTIGRELRDDEVVHHINEKRKDNRPENLLVIAKTTHQHIHLKGKKKTAQQRKNHSIGFKKFLSNGGIPSMTGKKHSEETKEKMREAYKKRKRG